MLKMLGDLNVPLPEKIAESKQKPRKAKTTSPILIPETNPGDLNVPTPEKIAEPKQKQRKTKTVPQILLPETSPEQPTKKEEEEAVSTTTTPSEAPVLPFFPNPICSAESDCVLSDSSTESDDIFPQPNKILSKSEAKELLAEKLEENNKKRKNSDTTVGHTNKRMKIPSIRNGMSVPGEHVFIPVRDKFVLLGLCKICYTESLAKIKLKSSGKQFITFVMCAKCVQKNKFLHANISSKLKF